MTPETFLHTIGASRRLAQMARAIPAGDITEAIADAERADTLGPIIDPTLWRDANGGLTKLLRDLRALARYRQEVTNP